MGFCRVRMLIWVDVFFGGGGNSCEENERLILQQMPWESEEPRSREGSAAGTDDGSADWPEDPWARLPQECWWGKQHQAQLFYLWLSQFFLCARVHTHAHACTHSFSASDLSKNYYQWSLCSDIPLTAVWLTNHMCLHYFKKASMHTALGCKKLSGLLPISSSALW